MFKFNKLGYRMSQTVQLHTSNSQCLQNDLNISSESVPVFSSEINEDVVDIFRDNDILYNSMSDEQLQSLENSKNLNPLVHE